MNNGSTRWFLINTFSGDSSHCTGETDCRMPYKSSFRSAKAVRDLIPDYPGLEEKREARGEEQENNLQLPPLPFPVPVPSVESGLDVLSALLKEAGNREVRYKFELKACQQELVKEQETRREVQTALEMMSCEFETAQAARMEAEDTAYKATKSASASARMKSVCVITLCNQISQAQNELAELKLVSALRSSRLDDTRADAEYYIKRNTRLEVELKLLLQSLE